MHDDVMKAARRVLKTNNRGTYTQPAADLYPHQWLWDSCFTAIGLRHSSPARAQKELTSLLRGQWHNGMLPNIIFRNDPQYNTDRRVWASWLNPYAPSNVATTGITQPPMLAEAIVRVGEKLGAAERKHWYRQMYEPLVAYHEWLYADRDPHGEGLVLLIHPWESGTDNAPSWMHQLHDHQLSWWVSAAEALHLAPVINLFRRDTKSVPSDERFSAIEALALFDAQRRLKRKAYDIDRILDHGLFAIEDIIFNSILVRANTLLAEIADTIHEELPHELLTSMHRTRKALESLRDPVTGQYYSRDFITHNLLNTPTIGTLLPLYAGTISAEHAAQLVKLIEDDKAFGTPYPLPSVPQNSPDFDAKRYWQGPTWVNMNWLIIDGLTRYGYKDHAEALRESTLEMITRGGFHEYFNPLNGQPEGGADFSWTAALTIDLLHQND